MGIVEAKCTSCGANLKVDNEQEAAVCVACNNAYIVEKAINYYNKTYNFNSNTTNNISNSVVMMSHSDEEYIVNQLKDAKYYEHYDRKKALHIYHELRQKFPREPRISVQQIQNELKRLMKLKESAYFDQAIFDIMVQHRKLHKHFYGAKQQTKPYSLYQYASEINGIYNLCIKNTSNYTGMDHYNFQWLLKLNDAIKAFEDFRMDDLLKLWAVDICLDNLTKIKSVEGEEIKPEIKDMIEETLKDCDTLNTYRNRLNDYVNNEVIKSLETLKKSVKDFIYLKEAQFKRTQLIEHLERLNKGDFTIRDYNTIYYDVLKQKERYRKSARDVGVYMNPRIHQLKDQLSQGIPVKYARRSRKLYTLDNNLIAKQHQDARVIRDYLGNSLNEIMPKLMRHLSTI